MNSSVTAESGNRRLLGCGATLSGTARAPGTAVNLTNQRKPLASSVPSGVLTEQRLQRQSPPDLAAAVAHPPTPELISTPGTTGRRTSAGGFHTGLRQEEKRFLPPLARLQLPAGSSTHREPPQHRRGGLGRPGLGRPGLARGLRWAGGASTPPRGARGRSHAGGKGSGPGKRLQLRRTTAAPVRLPAWPSCLTAPASSAGDGCRDRLPHHGETNAEEGFV